MNDLKAVFFDVDDTLWDRRGCARHALEIILPRYMDHLPEEDIENVIRQLNAVFLELPAVGHLRGVRNLRWLRRFEALLDSYNVDDPDLAGNLARTFDHTRRMTTRRFLRPGAVDLLEELGRRGLQRGVIVNGSPAVQRNILQSLGLDQHLDHVVLAAAEGMSKPDARLFRRAVEQAEVASAEMLYVGDSPITDVLGAARAGIRTAWFRTGWRGIPAGFPTPDHVVTDLPEVLSLF